MRIPLADYNPFKNRKKARRFRILFIQMKDRERLYELRAQHFPDSKGQDIS